MSEDEYDDELPPISVNSSGGDTQNLFTMPSAEVLASQRAREEECERELRLLREDPDCGGESLVLGHSDSNSSDGEASLAAAVTALNVQAASKDAGDGPSAIQYFTALKQRLSPEYDTQFLQDYIEVLQQADAETVEHVTDEIVKGVSTALTRPGGEWSPSEVVVMGSWMCLVLISPMAALTSHRWLLVRSAHCLFRDIADNNQVRAVCGAVSGAVRAPAPLLWLSDALRSPSPSPSPHCPAPAPAPAHVRLAAAAAHRLLHEGEGEGEGESDGGGRVWEGEGEGEGEDEDEWWGERLAAAAGRQWRRLRARQRLVLLQLAGRALRDLAPTAPATAGAAAARLLAALAPAPAAPAAADMHHPDHLKVLIGVSKLNLLFRSEAPPAARN